jgi:hypothetical protein
VREVRLPKPEDDMDRWRRLAAESDERRAAAKAELRREEGDNARVLSALGRIAALERRVAEAEQLAAQSDETMRELARGAEAFSAAVSDVLDRVETKLTQLNSKIVELRSLDDVRRGEIIDLPDFRRRANYGVYS